MTQNPISISQKPVVVVITTCHHFQEVVFFTKILKSNDKVLFFERQPMRSEGRMRCEGSKAVAAVAVQELSPKSLLMHSTQFSV